MQQMMYRLGMAERIHLGTAASAQRSIEDLAQAGEHPLTPPWCLAGACSALFNAVCTACACACTGSALLAAQDGPLCCLPDNALCLLCLLCNADAERAEVLGQPPLDFGCTIMVLGLSGTGKTATINSLLGRPQPVGYKQTNKVRLHACGGWLGGWVGGWVPGPGTLLSPIHPARCIS
jgi:hypothetical protein